MKADLSKNDLNYGSTSTQPEVEIVRSDMDRVALADTYFSDGIIIPPSDDVS